MTKRLQDAARAEHQGIEGRALTEDRAALTAWMTRSTGKQLEAPAPSYGSMPDDKVKAGREEEVRVHAEFLTPITQR